MTPLGGVAVFTVFLSTFFMFSFISGSASFPKPLSAEEEKMYLEKIQEMFPPIYSNTDKFYIIKFIKDHLIKFIYK